MGKKIIKRALTVLKVFLFTVIILFAGLILIQRFSNSTFSVGGYRIFAVVTGSMEPVYKIGDVLLCKSVDTNTLKVGDDVTYKGELGTFKDKIITHRLIKIEEKDGKKTFFTKGVASSNVDPPIEGKQIYGKVSRRLAFLSVLHSYSSSNIGFFIFVIIPIMLLVGSEIVQSMLDKHQKIEDMKNANNGVIQDVNVQNNVNQTNMTQEQIKQEILNLQQQVMAQQAGQVQNNQSVEQVNNTQVQTNDVNNNNQNQ